MTTMHSIRCARPSDLIYLPAIEREAAAQFKATPYPAMADADLASARLDLDHDYVWVLADEQDRPIGFAIAHVLDESVHLHELDVLGNRPRRLKVDVLPQEVHAHDEQHVVLL